MLTNLSHKLRKDGMDDHAKYDVLALNDIQVMAKGLGAVLKPEAYEHMFYSALRLAVWYKAFSSK